MHETDESRIFGRGLLGITLSKWQTLSLLALAELLAMSVWFSASAVVPVLTDVWSLSDSGRSWLTMSVQMGFVIGAFGSAVFNLADRARPHLLFSISALAAAASTFLIPASGLGLPAALALRGLTGFFLAGVYPVGMKIMATWTKGDRGFAIGLLVGALTLGSGAPHLLNAFGGVDNWQFVLYISALFAALGGLVALAFVDEGPYRAVAPPFRFGYVGHILRTRDLALAILGYLGHMWELFAMWTWIPVFLAASFAVTGIDPVWASALAFGVFGAGAAGSLLAGQMADRLGRTTITVASLIISGACAVVAGFLFGGNPLLLAGLCLVWGFAVVADSAQFSAALSELSDRSYAGTALTLRTSLGFLLTLLTIRAIPQLVAYVGWRWAFASLTVGPIVGVWSMLALRRMPSAAKMAGGRR